MTRVAALVAFASVSMAVVLTARPARADSIAYSYEIENVDAHPGKVLVVWPRSCASSGEPLGVVDLKLNPDWSTRMHDVDYEVVGKGGRELLELCMKTSRLFALPADAFPRGSRVSTADDTAIGQPEAGVSFVILPALDAIDLKKRIELFEKDPRVSRSTFRFDPEAAAKRGPPGTKAVHEVLSVGAFEGSSFTVEVKRAVYMNADGGIVTASAGADAGARSDGGQVASPAPVAPPVDPVDRGTRWVYAAAVAGLVVGGIIAAMRKKKPGS